MCCLQGKSCGVYLASCNVSPCMNGATCTNLPNDFVCTCTLEYTGVICDVLLADVNPAMNTGENDKLDNAPIIGGVVGGIVLLVLLLVLVVVAIVLFQKNKKSYDVMSNPLPVVGENPVYMSGILSFDEDHKFDNPLYEDKSNGNNNFCCSRLMVVWV